MQTINKSIFIPINSKGEILIQDRTGHRPPPWGFFGGSIEEGETPIQGLIREIREELNLDIQESDVQYIGQTWRIEEDVKKIFNIFLYRKNINDRDIELNEGAGFLWISPLDAFKYISGETSERLLNVLHNIVIAPRLPELLLNDKVEVILNERNKTPHIGYINKFIWHGKENNWLYFINKESGKKVSKNYRIEDLKRLN